MSTVRYKMDKVFGLRDYRKVWKQVHVYFLSYYMVPLCFGTKSGEVAKWLGLAALPIPPPPPPPPPPPLLLGGSMSFPSWLRQCTGSVSYVAHFSTHNYTVYNVIINTCMLTLNDQISWSTCLYIGEIGINHFTNHFCVVVGRIRWDVETR